MGLDPFTATVLAISAATSVASVYQGRKSRKAQSRAARIAERRRAIENRRATLENVEDTRIAIGQVQNIASQVGAQGAASGFQGQISSFSQQLRDNQAFSDQLLTFAQAQERQLQKAFDRQAQAQTFAAISSLAFTLGNSGMFTSTTPTVPYAGQEARVTPNTTPSMTADPRVF